MHSLELAAKLTRFVRESWHPCLGICKTDYSRASRTKNSANTATNRPIVRPTAGHLNQLPIAPPTQPNPPMNAKTANGPGPMNCEYRNAARQAPSMPIQRSDEANGLTCFIPRFYPPTCLIASPSRDPQFGIREFQVVEWLPTEQRRESRRRARPQGGFQPRARQLAV